MNTSTAAGQTKKPARSQKESQNTQKVAPGSAVLLSVIESALLRYKEAGGTFSVIRLEKEGGAGIFLPGVDYIEGKLILCSQKTVTESQNPEVEIA